MKSKLKALIIDDDAIQRTSLKIELDFLGIKDILVSSDGLEALDILSRNHIDIVFCDISMPNMDGVKFLMSLADISVEFGIVVVSAAENDICDATLNICSLLGFSYCSFLSKYDIKASLNKEINTFIASLSKVERNLDVECLTLGEIESAFTDKRIINYYQPKVDFCSGSIKSVEALVRLDNGKGVLLSPICFLYLMEENGFMNRLFFVVLEQALLDLNDLNLSVSINMAQENLEIEDVCDKVLAYCHEYKFSSNKLTLELTESQAYKNTPIALANLARLRINGVKLSIDDFGTGYASLSKLLELPFNELKVDRSFIKNLPVNKKNQELTKLIYNLSDTLNMDAVVEGVEDKETWHILKDIGFKTCQGYFTGPPMNLNSLKQRLDRE